MDIIERREVRDAMIIATEANRNKDSDVLAGAILIASAIESHASAVGRVADNLKDISNRLGVLTCHIEGVKFAMNKRNDIEKEKTN